MNCRFLTADGLRLTALAGALFASVGCASQRDALNHELEQVRADVKALRAANLALQDRLEALEAAPRSTGAPAPEATESAAGATDRPSLAVVRLLPETEQPVAPAAVPAAPGDEVPRPLLVGDERGTRVEDEGALAPGGGGKSKVTPPKPAAGVKKP